VTGPIFSVAGHMSTGLSAASLNYVAAKTIVLCTRTV